jgi:hypothetical protein
LFYVLCSNLVGKRQDLPADAAHQALQAGLPAVLSVWLMQAGVKGERIRISAISCQLSELIVILIHKS